MTPSENERNRIANIVARDWRDYGTPTRSQCKKIALHALELSAARRFADIRRMVKATVPDARGRR